MRAAAGRGAGCAEAAQLSLPVQTEQQLPPATTIFCCLSGSKGDQACFELEFSVAGECLPFAAPTCTAPRQHPGTAGSTHSKAGLSRIWPPTPLPLPFGNRCKTTRQSARGLPHQGCSTAWLSPTLRRQGCLDPSPPSSTDLHDTAQRPHIRLWPMALPQQHFWGQVVGGPTYCPVGQSARSVHAPHPLANSLPPPKPWDLACSLSSPPILLFVAQSTLHLQEAP